MYGGTSDISEDCDCVYILDKRDGYMTGNDVAIDFVNEKTRGDVADKLSVSYSKELGQSYEDLVGSVIRSDKGKLEELRVNAEITPELEQDEDIITAVRSAFYQDITSKAAIVKLVADETGITQSKIRQV